MVLEEGIGITGHALTTPSPLIAGHTVGGLLFAGGLTLAGIYFLGKGARKALHEIGVIN